MGDSNKPFKIAHLSDLHLTAKDGASRSEPDLFSHLKGMNVAFRTIFGSQEVKISDIVLVTGDVIDQGDLEFWRVFGNTVTEASLKDRMRVIPGKRDVCCLGARLPWVYKQYREDDMKKVRKG